MRYDMADLRGVRNEDLFLKIFHFLTLRYNSVHFTVYFLDDDNLYGFKLTVDIDGHGQSFDMYTKYGFHKPVGPGDSWYLPVRSEVRRRIKHVLIKPLQKFSLFSQFFKSTSTWDRIFLFFGCQPSRIRELFSGDANTWKNKVFEVTGFLLEHEAEIW